MKLYELTKDYQTVLDLIADGSEGLDDTLESLGGAIEDKVENIAKVIKTLEARSAAYKAEEARMSTNRLGIDRNIKRLKDYAEQSLLSVGKRKIEGQLFTVSIQKNAARLEILDDTLIPECYQFLTTNIDKTMLKTALKAGEVIDGACLVQGESLRIK